MDIRLEIYDWVFYSTTLSAKDTDRFDVVPVPPPGGVDLDDDWPCSARTEVDIYRCPVMDTQLNLVCRLLDNEIGHSWHSKVEYSFYCSVAFIDVLSQWPEWKVTALRYAHIEGYPIPLYRIDQAWGYTTHFVHDIFSIFPTLRLDTLTVENVWLCPDGEEMEGWCLGATLAELHGLLASEGWKTLKYLSGTLGLLSRQVRELDEAVVAMRKARGEDKFTYRLQDLRPRLCGISSSDGQGNRVDEDTDEDKAEVAQWEAEHPEPRDEPTVKEVQMLAMRGTEDFESKVDDRSNMLKGLLEKLSWIEVRKAGRFLVEDGTEDPGAHL